MAEAAVQFLLENLKNLLEHQLELIKNVEKEVEELVENMTFFKSFLKKVSGKKLRKDGPLRDLVREIRNVIYDADDAIDAYIIQAADKKPKIFSLGIATKVNDIYAKIINIYGAKDKYDLVNFADADVPDESPLPQPVLSEVNVVGLEDEMNKIVGYLNESTPYLDVITIVGMPGLGKTTLTRKIYNDQEIITKFHPRLWVYVSSDCKEREVFHSILKQLKTKLDEDEYGTKSTGDLAEEIARELEGVKFLLVMDDVWEKKDWKKLKLALPKRNVMGKVIITSRDESVGHVVNRRKPHNLRPMNIDESCELLRRQVFNELKFPIEFAKVGKEIASKCAGLPLAIVVIGGVLTTKDLKSVDGREEVSKSMHTFMNEDDENNKMDDAISMSYHKLPYHLQECFLYLGMFPEDSMIPAWKLIQMWIAEGLIEPKKGISMEDRGKNFLKELISKSLISVERLNADGSVKTCHMHDILRDFCKRQGARENDNFLQEIEETGEGGLESLVRRDRRLCIHSEVIKFLSKSPKGARVRSFVTFSENTEMPPDKVSAISGGFKLLRVLEAEPLNIGKIPSDFFNLVHLRYLVLSLMKHDTTKCISQKSNNPSLPIAFEKLWNLQTLVVKTKSPVLDIKANIMKMAQLKHVKSNASINLANPGTSTESEKLQTLCNMSIGSYTVAILGKACNLKKLGIQGKLASFLYVKPGSVHIMRNLTKLQKLKLLNDTFSDLSSIEKLPSLPPHYQFPPMLNSLTLKATHLEWTGMSVLEQLEKLQVLKLKDNAFKGLTWKVKRGFTSLEYLHIERTDLTIWEADAHHFPMLKRLKLHNCGNLKQIPSDIPQLEELELRNCKGAAYTANKIAEAKKNVPTFKLSVSLV